MSKRETGQNQRDVKRLLEQAVAHHQAGRLQEAEWGYQAVLKMQPGHIDAQHNLGVVAMQGNRPQQALPHLKSALEGRPDIGQYWLSYIAALMQAGQPEVARQILAQGRQRGLQGAEADRLEQTLGRTFPAGDAKTTLIALYQAGRYAEMAALAERQIADTGTDPYMYHLLGVAYLLSGQPERALDPLQRAISLRPAYVEAMSNLGNALRQLGRHGEAIDMYRQAVAVDARQAEVHSNLACSLHDVGRYEEALESYRSALGLNPDFVTAYFNQGNTLAALQRLPEAVASFQQAIALGGDHPDLFFNLGAALADSGKYDEAIHWYRQALARKPDLAAAKVKIGWCLASLYRHDEAIAEINGALQVSSDSALAYACLGSIYDETGRYDEARQCYEKALSIDPALAEAWFGLGKLYVSIGSPERSLMCYEKAMKIAPEIKNNPDIVVCMAAAYQTSGRLDESAQTLREFLSRWPEYPAAYGNLLFSLNYHPDLSEEEIYSAYQAYDEQYAVSTYSSHLNSRESGRRLKVGYVSPDFNTHAVGKFLEPLLSGHNKAELEIYGYAELRREDEATERYKRYVDHWIPTRELSHAELAERIRQDGIDILVDVAGHTANNRLQVFAKKPAPVSVSWLGFGYTTGLKAIDYFLTDGTSVPEGTEHLYAEKPWRLEGSAYVYRPAAGMGEVSPLPALEQGHITFGTLTRAVRINHRVIRVWSEILKRVAGSKLVIDSANYQDGKLCEELVEKFAAEGIEPERLDIGYHSPPWDVLRGMDIGLDCFPHNSGTTLFESLYMGIPYVTLAGRTSPRRLGSSILKGVGHPEWITETEEAYIEKVVDLAEDKERLAAIRGRLREEMEAGPLRDEAGFVQRVEQAYRHMFKNWAETQT